jgi:hypothetical protein
MKKFTAKEIEPFVMATQRPGGLNRGVFVAILGVALQKADGRWETHELTDEIDGDSTRRLPLKSGEQLRCKAVFEMKRRLLGALNRLREHYDRVYVYPGRDLTLHSFQENEKADPARGLFGFWPG